MQNLSLSRAGSKPLFGDLDIRGKKANLSGPNYFLKSREPKETKRLPGLMELY